MHNITGFALITQLPVIEAKRRGPGKTTSSTSDEHNDENYNNYVVVIFIIVVYQYSAQNSYFVAFIMLALHRLNQKIGGKLSPFCLANGRDSFSINIHIWYYRK